MNLTKLTVRVQRERLENLKHYAARNHTTLTELINAYLERVPGQGRQVKAPTVMRLSGVLSLDVSLEDYRKHLEEKYAR